MKTFALRAVLTVALMFFSCTAMTSQTKPDFAYPKTVVAQSRQRLAKALKTADDVAAVRAMADIALAEAEISPDSIASTLALLHDTAARLAGRPIAEAVLATMEARILLSVYDSERYVFDERTLPKGAPLPADPMDWDAATFRSRIDALLADALSRADALYVVPLARWKAMVDMTPLTAVYRPTLFDFVASQACDIYGALGDDARRTAVLRDIAARDADRPAPRIAALVQLIVDSGSDEGDTDEALWRLYDSEKDRTEFSGDVLLAIGERVGADDIAARRRLWDAINDNLRRWPAYPLAGNLKQRLAELAQQSVSVKAPKVVAPGRDFNLSIESRNAVSGYVRIYRLPLDKALGERFRTLKEAAPIARETGAIPFSLPDTVPFLTTLDTRYRLDAPGVYFMVPCIGEDAPSLDRRVELIYCTTLTSAFLDDEKARFYALDLESGAPVPGAELYAVDAKAKKIGETNAEGYIDRDGMAGIHYGSVTAVKDGSISLPLYVHLAGSARPDESMAGAVFTDLPLYHRGDTLHFAAMAYVYGVGYSRVCRDMPLRLSLVDANYEEVETLDLVTDDGGRAEGSFRLPSDRLTGVYRLELRRGGDDGRYLGDATFTVSDYRLPTFSVEMEPAETTAAGDAVLRGRAMGYNGLPVANADVTVPVVSQPRFRWWWQRGASNQFFDGRVSTGPDGRFELALSPDDIAAARYPDGLLTAEVTATSASGESQTASCRFIMKAAYVLSADLRETADVSDGLRFTVEARDFRGDAVALRARYAIKPAENSAGPDSVFEGELVTGSPVTVNLPAGAWTLTVTPVDADLAEPLAMSFTAWRRDSSLSPVTDVLWTPGKNISLASDKPGISVYASRPTYILYSVYTPERGMVAHGVLPVEAGRTLFSPSLPEGWEEASVRMYAVAGYSASTLDVDLRNSAAGSGLDVVVATFRDRITPGAEESVTLRFKPRNCRMPAPVALRVYNAALDALSPEPWSLYVSSMEMPGPSWSTYPLDRILSASAVTAIPRMKTVDVADPEFRTYGLTWNSGRLVYCAEPLMLMKASRAATTDAMNESVADMDASLATGGPDEGTEEKEREVVPESAMPQVKFRESEVPLALFAPSLWTGEDGTLTVTYTVPDANATWLYEAVGWTVGPVVSALWKAAAVASRPLMVQPNMPRFLRKGDVAVVNTTVFNNSDAAAGVTVDIELFDPRDNATLTAYTRTLMIAAEGSETIAAEIDTRSAAYDGLDAVGFRVSARGADGGADGEQALLRLLPAVGQVAESRPFWIAPDTELFETALPEAADARVDVSLESNPVAAVLSALPGMINTPGTTSCSAANALFSTAIASMLVGENPDLLLEGPPTWTLDKDGLARTPWVNAARADAERSGLLALLAGGGEGEKGADALTEKAVAALAAFECKDGGWKWSGFDDGMSLWATMNNLGLLGRMHALGADKKLPSAQRRSLEAMTRRALEAMDRAVAEEYRRWPGGNYMLYTSIRDLWSDVCRPSADAAKVISATVQQLLGRWPDLDSPDKALAAQILEAHSYHRVAAEIIRSLEEHSESSKEQGMWWPVVVHRNSPVSVIGASSMILDAWHAVAPRAPQIDLIRQWMILRKHTQDWGTSAVTTDAIASILTTSERWMKAPALGDVDMTMADGRLSIRRGASSDPLPLFGAVNSVFTPNAGTPVEAAPCQGIVAIEKRVARVADDGSLVEGRLKVGDRVRVTLDIRVEQALSYIVVRDNRPACFEPVEQMPSREYAQTLGYYRENLDDATVMCFGNMPVGTYQISYDVFVNNSGCFTLPTAQLESQYAPEVAAHSAAGAVLKVE